MLCSRARLNGCACCACAVCCYITYWWCKTAPYLMNKYLLNGSPWENDDLVDE